MCRRNPAATCLGICILDIIALLMEKLELLAAVDLFSQLSNQDLGVLADHAEFYEFGPGDVIFAAGTVDRELFVIESGEVRIYRDGPEGREIDLAQFVAGESFGEQDFLSEEPRTASAVSETTSRVLVFPTRGTSFHETMIEHPKLFARVLHQFLVIVAGRIRSTNQLVSENSGWVQELRQQVFGDKLTGLYSRSYLDDEFGGILGRARGPMAFLMVKPDNFKLINDTFGHEVGDHVLRILANHLKTLLDEGQTPVRYRGNEFAVIAPNAEEETAVRLAERLRVGMRAADLTPVTGDTDVPLTFSVGVAVHPEHGSAEEIIASAHELVFVSRDSGGNKVLVVSPPDAEAGPE